MLDKIVAGDTLDFLVTVADYPASAGWTMKYRLTPQFSSPTQAAIDLDGSAEGDDYRIQANPTTTALWVPGRYSWARWVEQVGARQTLNYGGQLDVRPDPSQSIQGDDVRSHSQICVDNLKAVIQGKATLDQKGFSIGDKSLQRMDAKELETWLSYHQAILDDEDAKSQIAIGGPNKRVIGVRFNRV